MPEQDAGGNIGVGTATDGGGGNNMNSIDNGTGTQGGGGQFGQGSTSTGSSNTSGTQGVNTVPPTDWNKEVSDTLSMLNTVLTPPGFLLTLSAFTQIFVNAKFGKLINDLQVSPEVKRQELDKLVDYYQGVGKPGVKKEYEKLKEAYSDSLKAFKEIIPQIKATLIDVFMPPTFTGVPNVGSKLLQLGIRIKAILTLIHFALTASKKYLDLAEDYGLQEFQPTKGLITALKPMVETLEMVESQLQKLGAVFSKEEADEANKVMKAKLTKVVMRRIDKMTEIAEEVVDNIAEGESTGDNKKLLKRFAKIYRGTERDISKGVNAYGIASDNNPLGVLEQDAVAQLIAIGDITGAIEAGLTGGLTELGARNVAKKYDLSESVITYVNKLMSDFLEEDIVITVKGYLKTEGIKLNK